MKLLLILTVGCLVVMASIFDEDESRIHGENGWYVPRKDGSFDWVDKAIAETHLEAMKNIENFYWTIKSVDFYLYTKSNPKNGKYITTTSKSINASKFNPAHPTRFIIHGWLQSCFSAMNKDIRDAWLSLGEYNIIIVDWAAGRLFYDISVSAVPTVGKKIAVMIDFLVNNYGMPLHTLYVIGFSLGAHIAGFAGKNVKTGQIHTIIGLDPAWPLYDYDEPAKRLSNTDAYYVETIQTYGFLLGFMKPIGKGTFYPNGGKSQPGCSWDISGICSHFRSIAYYAEAVAHNNFPAFKCKNYKDAISKKCETTSSSVRMGSDRNADMVAGIFYVPTNKKPPFGILT